MTMSAYNRQLFFFLSCASTTQPRMKFEVVINCTVVATQLVKKFKRDTGVAVLI
jgi:hypothetical protein